VDGDALLGEQRGDAAGGEADAGLVDAEDLADEAAGHAEVLPVAGGQDVVVQAEPGGPGRAGAALAGAAAGQVQPLLAGSLPGEGHGGYHGGEVGYAGQCEVGQGGQVRPGGAGSGRGEFDKSRNRPASSTRRLMIEAVYPL